MCDAVMVDTLPRIETQLANMQTQIVQLDCKIVASVGVCMHQLPMRFPQFLHTCGGKLGLTAKIAQKTLFGVHAQVSYTITPQTQDWRLSGLA